jgi:branched-chain amino acid transport system substrate-binding protein
MIRPSRLASRLNWFLCLTSVAIVVVGSSCGSSTGSSQSGKLLIGSPLALTGPAAFAGLEIQKGMQVATDEINSTGFLGQTKVDVKYADGGSTAQQTVLVTRQLIEQDHVNALVGNVYSSTGPPVAAVAQAGKTPLILTEGGSVGVSATGDYITQTNLSEIKYISVVAQVMKSLGVKKVGLIYALDSPNAVIITNSFKDQVLPAAGISVVTVKGYLNADTNMTAGITQAMAAGADAIHCDMTGAAGITCITQTRSAGFKGYIFGGAGLAGGTVLKAGPAAEGVMFTTNFDAAMPFPKTKTFVDLFKAKFNANPSGFAAEGYDAVWLVAQAVKISNSTSRDGIKAGLATVEAAGYDGVMGHETWNNGPGGDRMMIAPGCVDQIKNGAQVLVQVGGQG